MIFTRKRQMHPAINIFILKKAYYFHQHLLSYNNSHQLEKQMWNRLLKILYRDLVFSASKMLEGTQPKNASHPFGGGHFEKIYCTSNRANSRFYGSSSALSNTLYPSKPNINEKVKINTSYNKIQMKIDKIFANFLKCAPVARKFFPRKEGGGALATTGGI